MKNVIKKAIENNAELSEIMRKHIKSIERDTDYEIVEVNVYDSGCPVISIEYITKSHEFYGDSPSGFEIGLHYLIFGTDLVDRVVRERACKDCTHGGKKDNAIGKCFGTEMGCLLLDNDSADYHLQQMSAPEISRDIEKLKEYLRSLI